FFSSCSRSPLYLRSFPTRRSSDLTHNVFWVVFIRVPEVHFSQPVGFVCDFVGETKVVEGFHRASLNAVGLTQHKTTFATLNKACVYIRVGRQGGCRGHAGRPGANDHHVHGVWKFIRAIQTDSRCWLDARLSGDISVMVKLHDLTPVRLATFQETEVALYSNMVFN